MTFQEIEAIAYQYLQDNPDVVATIAAINKKKPNSTFDLCKAPTAKDRADARIYLKWFGRYDEIISDVGRTLGMQNELYQTVCEAIGEAYMRVTNGR